MKVVDLEKLKNFVVDNFSFEFVQGLKQSIYARFRIICGEPKDNIDTCEYWVEWLGAEDVKQDDRGLSAGGREARVFRAKNRLTCDLRRMAVQWGLSWY